MLQPAYVDEVTQQAAPLLGVVRLGVKLYAPHRSCLAAEDGDRDILRRRQHLKALGQDGDRVTVRHPDGRPLGESPEERVLCPLAAYGEMSATILVQPGLLDGATQFAGDQLGPVADRQDRETSVDQRLHVDPEGARVVDGVGAAAEDDALDIGEVLRYRSVRHHLAVDTEVSHTASDELGRLGAKV